MLRRIAQILVLCFLPAFCRGAEPQQVPSISGDAGECSAEITVTDSAFRPVYDAKIAVQIKHGFAGLHRTDLEVSTNSDGKARVDGLPDRVRRPFDFNVTYKGRNTTVIVDPEQRCNGSYSAVLPDKPFVPPGSDADEDQ
jgi:hypothetical protein